MSIRLVLHKDIDPSRWDDCISRFFNGCVYAYSWYLDRVCDNWIALIDGDYEALMPLPVFNWKGNNIIDMPVLSKYLGVFSNKLMTNQLISSFINAIPSEYCYVFQILNKFNPLTEPVEHFHKQLLPIFTMDLMSNYTKISSQYNRQALESIQSALKHKMIVLSGLQTREYMSFYIKNKSKSSKKLDEKDIRKMRALISHSLFHNFGEILGAYDVNNNLCATAIFIGTHQKVYVPFHIVNNEPIALKALYLIFDNFIKKHSEKNILMSFEMNINHEKNTIFSDLGAIPSHCVIIEKNKLPIWHRWILR